MKIENMDSLVTIVIPIYNVEKFLNRCIQSIVSQTYEKLEILLVDDGSPDNCPSICDEWAKRDARIKVVHKQNEGLGMARNTGIDNASGDYICFFDSDDYVDSRIIERCVNNLIKKQSEIVTFGFSKVDSEGNIYKSYIPSCEKNIFCGKEITDDFLPDFISYKKNSKYKNLSISAWASMYSLKLIRKLGWRFVSERKIISEDIYSLIELVANCQRISVIEESLYFYCENPTSLTKVYRSDRYQKNVYFYRQIVKLCINLHLNNLVMNRLKYVFLGNSIGCMKLIVQSKEELSNKLNNIKSILFDDSMIETINSVNFKEEGFFRRIIYKEIKRKHFRIVYILIKLKK